MFAPLSKTQIIGISSNSREIHAYTSLLQHGSILFAFGSEHLVFIYDRQTFKQSIVDTLDPSSPLVAITFSGYGPDCKLICVNTNSIIYVYSMSNLNKLVYTSKTEHKPISITATDKLLFYQTENSIFINPIDFDSDNQIQLNQSSFILTDTNTHQRCLVSPCGRALATYTRGSGYPVIYYSPFKKKRCAVLPLQAKISDFQWGASEHLMAITADDLGNVRLWTESTTSYELHCVKWFHFDSHILSAAICISTDIENQTTQIKASSKHSDLVFPLIKRHPVLILAILDSKEKNVCLLQETANPHLEGIASVTMPLNAAITTLCDMRRIFSNHIIKRLISVTRFSRESLSFFQFEVGGNSFSTITPFSLDFIKSPIIKILKYKNPITIHKDGSCYDWLHSRYLNNIHSIIELTEYKNGEISICCNSIHYFYLEGEKKEKKVGFYRLNDTYEFATVYKFNNNSNVMIVLCNTSQILVVFFDGLKFIENSVTVDSELIRSATIHSTDLFAVSTDKSVDTYIFNNDHFEKFGTYLVDSPNALFIPHPYALIAISFKQSVKFFVVWRNRFIPLKELDPNFDCEQTIPKLRTITLLEDNVLLAATKSFFVEINIPKSTFPLPYDNNSSYVMLTSFSLAIWYPLFERLNGRMLSNKSFGVKMNSESFSFPSETPGDIPNALKTVCKSPPSNWGVLDDEGQRFLFSWILSRSYQDLRNYIPFFSIWALLSHDQSTLISSLQVDSFRMFCDTMIPVWAKDKNILRKAISVLITETIPKDEEVEDYLLLCILVGQFNVAKRIARIKHQNKLEKFLSSPFLDGNIKNKATQSVHNEDEDETFKAEKEKLKKKMEKSAFEAQKKHRFALSAMFFILRDMKQQAFIILKKRKMLYIIAARLLDVNNWPLILKGQFLNDFYVKYWTAKINKVDDDSIENDEKMTSITKMAKAKTLSTALFAPKEAVEALKKWDFPKSKIISIELHRYKILKKFDALQPNDILGLQKTPGFLKAQLDFLLNKIETAELLDSEIEKIPTSLTTTTTNSNASTTTKTEDKKPKQVQNEFEFNFGMDNADFDYFEYEEEELEEKTNENEDEITKTSNENKTEIIEDSPKSDQPSMLFSITAVIQAETNKRDKILYTSYFSQSFFEQPFQTAKLRILSYNENFIMYLISCILNNTFNKDTVRRIARIANDLFYSNEHILFVIAIIYTLSFALSRPSIMLPIFQKPLEINQCHFFVQQMSDGIYSIPNDSAPNILRNIVSQHVEITESDRLLANFITLHEFCAILSSKYIDLLNHKEDKEETNQLQTQSHAQFRNTLMNTNNNNLIRINRMNNPNEPSRIRTKLKVDPLYSIISSTDPSDLTKAANNDTNHNNNNDTDNKTNNVEKAVSSAGGKGIYDNGNNSCFTHADVDPYLSKVSNRLANYKVISFFHHLHRLNFDHLPSTTFTNQSFLQDLVALGISCWDLPDEMKASQIDKKWMISLDNPFISPFYFADHFQASKSFEIATRLEGRVFGICLDRYDPNFVAVCSNEKVEVINISSRKSKNSNLSNESVSSSLNRSEYNHSMPSLASMDIHMRYSSFDLYAGNRDINDNSSSTSYADNMYTSMMFDSPFVSNRVFTSGEATKVNKFEFFKKRDFTPLWQTDHTSFKEVNATCITAHPFENYFFIGSMTGRVYLASFDVKRNDSLNKKKITTIKMPAMNPSSNSQSNQAPPKSQSVSQLHSKTKNKPHAAKADMMHSISISNQFLNASSPTSTMMPGSSTFGRGTVIVNQSPTQSLTSTFTYSMKTNKMTTMNAIRAARDTAEAAELTSINSNSNNANLPPIPPSKSLNLANPNAKGLNDSSNSVGSNYSPSTVKTIKASKVAKSTMNSVCFYDGSVTSIKVNMTGDKILTTCDNGYVFLSDFQNSASLFVCSPRVSACWLNSDTQIIVWDPSNSSLLAYDTNAGLQPVATFKLPQRSYNYCPIDVYGSQVVTGYADGSVVMVDLKNSEIMQSMNVHKSPVSVLQFDKSGRFFISGSAENNIKIVNAKVEHQPFELPNAFSDYDVFGIDNGSSNSSQNAFNEYPGIFGLSSTQRGILNVDITDHTLVACGYSSNIHVWMVTDPFSSIV